MREKGQLITCDRCGKQTFQRELSKFSDEYEEIEDGWDFVPRVGNLCPECATEYDRLISEFMGAGKEGMYDGKDRYR